MPKKPSPESASSELPVLTTEIDNLDQVFFGEEELQDIGFVEARYGSFVAREFRDAIFRSRNPHLGSTPAEPTEAYTVEGVARNGW